MVETFGANFEASDVLRMFPTFVWKAQLAPSARQGIDDEVLVKLDEMRQAAAGNRRGTCIIWTNFVAWSRASMTPLKLSWNS